MRYEFPWPPRALSPNVSVHWRTLARAKRKYKEACEWEVLAADGLDPLQSPVTAQVTFVCDARRRDSDNHMAMLKPLWDAFVCMGVLEDDSKDALRIAEPKWERGEKKVLVELTEYKDIS
jgi:crossover junction endodeoxyribonuclease RusA